MSSRLPIIPRGHIHHRFRIKNSDVVVVGQRLGDLAHGVRVGGIERLAIGLRILRIAFGQRCDQQSLARARRSG